MTRSRLNLKIEMLIHQARQLRLEGHPVLAARKELELRFFRHERMRRDRGKKRRVPA